MMLKVDSPDTVGTPNVTTSVDGYHKDIQNGIIPAAFLQILKWNEGKCTELDQSQIFSDTIHSIKVWKRVKNLN